MAAGQAAGKSEAGKRRCRQDGSKATAGGTPQSPNGEREMQSSAVIHLSRTAAAARQPFLAITPNTDTYTRHIHTYVHTCSLGQAQSLAAVARRACDFRKKDAKMANDGRQTSGNVGGTQEGTGRVRRISFSFYLLHERLVMEHNLNCEAPPVPLPSFVKPLTMMHSLAVALGVG